MGSVLTFLLLAVLSLLVIVLLVVPAIVGWCAIWLLWKGWAYAHR